MPCHLHHLSVVYLTMDPKDVGVSVHVRNVKVALVPVRWAEPVEQVLAVLTVDLAVVQVVQQAVEVVVQQAVEPVVQQQAVVVAVAVVVVQTVVMEVQQDRR